ncbi:hypothetical protein CAOG_01339 [Capsaspora owczarzaki ATCC 30864]|uniref:hypothetical protein n=1 Tax=Capsaspora owczarzaki (strain ATCC 30864) TaxID=595528 RepID=UPI0001FE2996|nr:hypothetical protein CAOG_01339 [Capsaspora owczarzaki ATCC 30864]|eukprot:XP_004349859.1 hypothetical protein CAOG_01339 [Capsaspora owczarzaki ATCC 30864]
MSAVKQLNDGPSSNRYRFQSFNERIKKVSINVAHRVGAVAVEPEAGGSFFNEALMKWRELDCTREFVTFTNKVYPLVQTLHQLLFHKDAVIDALLVHLAEPNCAALPALLDLLAQLARDLREEFYPDFPRSFVIVARVLEEANDPPVIEAAFTALSYLFKFLLRYLIRDMRDVFRLYRHLLASDVRPYIRAFAAESFALLLRKVPANAFHNSVGLLLNLALCQDDEITADTTTASQQPAASSDISGTTQSTLAADYAPWVSEYSRTVKPEGMVEGMSLLIFETVRGVQHQFHSRAREILSTILDILLEFITHYGDSHPISEHVGEIVQAASKHMANFTTPEYAGTIIDCVVARLERTRLASRPSGDDAMQMEDGGSSDGAQDDAHCFALLRVLSEWIEYRGADRIQEPLVVLSALSALLQHSSSLHMRDEMLELLVESIRHILLARISATSGRTQTKKTASLNAQLSARFGKDRVSSMDSMSSSGSSSSSAAASRAQLVALLGEVTVLLPALADSMLNCLPFHLATALLPPFLDVPNCARIFLPRALTFASRHYTLHTLPSMLFARDIIARLDGISDSQLASSGVVASIHRTLKFPEISAETPFAAALMALIETSSKKLKAGLTKGKTTTSTFVGHTELATAIASVHLGFALLVRIDGAALLLPRMLPVLAVLDELARTVLVPQSTAQSQVLSALAAGWTLALPFLAAQTQRLQQHGRTPFTLLENFAHHLDILECVDKWFGALSEAASSPSAVSVPATHASKSKPSQQPLQVDFINATTGLLTLSTLNELLTLLVPNLSSPYSCIRAATLVLLTRCEQLPLLAIDSDTADERANPRSCLVFSHLLQAEQTPADLENFRTRLMHVRQVDTVVVAGRLPTVYIEPVLRCHLATLYLNFKPLWAPAMEMIGNMASRIPEAQFWQQFFSTFEASHSRVRASTYLTLLQGDDLNAEEAEDDDEMDESDEKQAADDAVARSAFIEAVETARASERPDHVNFHVLLLQLAATDAVMPFIERHGRELLPLFFDFIDTEYNKMYEGKGAHQDLRSLSDDADAADDDQEEDAEDASNAAVAEAEPAADDAESAAATAAAGAAAAAGTTDISANNKPLRALVGKKLGGFLGILAKLRNPKAAYQSDRLLALLLELLAKPEAALQAKALQCILAFKFPYLTPYREPLEQLCGEQSFRSALLALDMDADAGLVKKEHRQGLLSVMSRLLYAKMISRAGGRKQTLSSKRSAVLGYLMSLSEEEIAPFIDLVLEPFLASTLANMASLASSAAAHKQAHLPPTASVTVLELLDVSRRSQLAESLVRGFSSTTGDDDDGGGSLDPARVVPLRKQLGFLTVVFEIIQKLGVLALPYVDVCFAVVLNLTANASTLLQSHAVTSISPAFLTPLKSIRLMGLRRLSELFRAFADHNFNFGLPMLFSAVVNPRLPRFQQETAQSSSGLLDLFVVWSQHPELALYLARNVQYGSNLRAVQSSEATSAMDTTTAATDSTEALPILIAVFNCLSNPSITHQVAGSVLDLAGNVVALLETHPAIANEVLLPHVGCLLQNLQVMMFGWLGDKGYLPVFGKEFAESDRRFAASRLASTQLATSVQRKHTGQTLSQQLVRRNLQLLAKLSHLTTDPEQCRVLVCLLLPFLKKRSVGSVATQSARVSILGIVEQSIPLLPMTSAFYAYLSQLFATLEGREPRTLLCRVFAAIAAHHDPSVQLTADLLARLNAYLPDALDEMDYDTRLVAFAELNDSVAGNLTCHQLLPLAHCYVHFLHADDFGIRDNASYGLLQLIRRVHLANAKHAAGVASKSSSKGGKKATKQQQQQQSTESASTSSTLSIDFAVWTPHEVQLIFDEIILQIIVPAIKIGVRVAQDAVRNEVVGLLRALVEKFPTHPQFADMTCLLNTQDPGAPEGADLPAADADESETMQPEATAAAASTSDAPLEMAFALANTQAIAAHEEAAFFVNICHVQLHRRARAMRILARCADEGRLAQSSIVHYFLPLISHVVIETTRSSDHNIVTEAIRTVAMLARQLSWSHYYKAFQSALRTLKKNSELQTTIVRLLVAIIESFHFDLQPSEADILLSAQEEVIEQGGEEADAKDKSAENVVEAEDDEDDDEGADEEGQDEPAAMATADSLEARIAAADKMKQAVLSRLLPSLHNVLVTKKGDTEHVRSPVAIAIVSLLMRLPRALLDARISGVIARVCNLLKSHNQQARDEARATLGEMLQTVGAEFLPVFLRNLQNALARGYQLHILGFTLHAVLSRVLALHTANPVPASQEAVDSCAPDIVRIILDDTFGEVGKEKEVQGITAKSKEARSRRGGECMELLCRLISFKFFPSVVLSPMSSLLEAINSVSDKSRIEELLRRAASGLTVNPSVQIPMLLICVYSLLERSVEQLRAASSKKKAGNNSPAAIEARNASKATAESFERPMLINSSTASGPMPTAGFDDDDDASRKPGNRRTNESVGLAEQPFSSLSRLDIAFMVLPAVRRDRAPSAETIANAHVLVEFGLVLLRAFFKRDLVARRRPNLGSAKPSNKKAARAIPAAPADAAEPMEVDESTDSSANKEAAVDEAPAVDDQDALYVETLQMLDPLVRILCDCLVSRHSRVLSLSLKCLSFMYSLPLPTMSAMLHVVVERVLRCISRAGQGSQASELVQSCMRAVIALILRKPAPGSRSTESLLQEKQLTALLALAKEGIEAGDHDRQTTTFALIRAIVTKKLVSTQLVDVIEHVADVSVRSQFVHVRQACSHLLVAFILDHPTGQRVKVRTQFIQFLVNNLGYEYQTGRESVIETIHTFLLKAPAALIPEVCEYLFLALAPRLVNDEAAICREMCMTVVRTLVARCAQTAPDKEEALFNLTMQWLGSTKESMRRMSAQMAGAFVSGTQPDARVQLVIARLVECVSLADWQRQQRERRLAARRSNDDDDNDAAEAEQADDEHQVEAAEAQWQLVYMALSTLSKLIQAMPRIAEWRESTPLWEVMPARLLHSHSWVRLAAARLWGLACSKLDVPAVVALCTAPAAAAPEPEPLTQRRGKRAQTPAAAAAAPVNKLANHALAVYLTGHGNAVRIAHSLCRQMASRILDNALAEQIVKNLFFVSKLLLLCPPLNVTLDARERTRDQRFHARQLASERADQADATADANRAAQASSEAVLGDAPDPDAATAVDSDYEETADIQETIQDRDGQTISVEDAREKYCGLTWMFRSLAFTTRVEYTKNPRNIVQRSHILKWFAAMAATLGPHLVIPFLDIMLSPVYRIVTDDSGTKNESLITLGNEVVDLLQQVVGPTRFHQTYNAVRTQVQNVRSDRKRNRVIQAVVDPAAAARRKIKKNLGKREARRNKIAAFKPDLQLRRTNKRVRLDNDQDFD